MKKTIIIILAGLVVVGGMVLWNKNKGGMMEIKNETAQSIAVKLYYYNPEKDKDAKGNILCSKQGLEPLDREFESSNSIIDDTIRLLMVGNIRNDEREKGISSEYPLPGLDLMDSDLEGGLLTLRFVDSQNKTTGGACRTAVLWAQIEATALQFEEVKEVKYLPEELFQP